MRQFFTTIITGLTLATSGISYAQDADDLMSESIVLMEKSSWQDALAKVSEVIKEHGESGVKKFGPKFGVAYYYQGLCELKLAQQARIDGKKEDANGLYKRSISSLQKCYSIKNTEEQLAKGNENNYRVKALMLKGNAEQAIDQFDEAIKSYEKFLLERNNIRDTVDIADFNINLAICHWNIGKEDEKAEQLYLRSLKATYLPATTRNKLTGLRAMIECYSERNKRSSIESFMRSHGEHFRTPLASAEEALPYVSALTLEAAQLGLIETVNVLANAIPSDSFQAITEQGVDQLEEIAELYLGEELEINGVELDGLDLTGWEERKAELQEALSEAEQLAVCARAIVYEKEGFYLGALSAYEYLLESKNYVNSFHKADYFYNASRLAVVAGDLEKSYRYGTEFFKQHKEHKHRIKLQKLLMVTYYYTGDYKKCRTIGEQYPLGEEAESGDMNWYLFTLGGASYYESEFANSEKLLSKHKQEFPTSEYAETVSYLYASSLCKLQQWQKSVELLDAYIGSDPKDKTYIPFAYYDKAYALYSVQKYPEAEKELARFQGNFKESVVKPEAHILLGNIYSIEKKRTKAETEYKAAIIVAKRVGNQHAKEEAYYLLISLLGQRTWDGLSNPRLLETIPEFEAFMNEPDAQKSPYFTQIVTASFDALEQAKRKDEAYDKLLEAIFLNNEKPNTPGIESAIKTYTIAKRREEISDEETIKSFTESKHLQYTPYHAGLILAIELDVLELSQKLSPKPERLEKIKQLYLNLHVEHDITMLDNFVLIKVAEFMKTNGGIESDSNAKKYYQAVLDSGSKIKRPQAFTGLATELAKSENAEDREAAMKQFSSIIDNPFTLAQPKADAHYQLIEILFAQEKYEELTNQIRAYLKYPTSAKDDIRRVEMLLAISYDKQGLADKAIGAYNAVWVNSFENLDQSAPAIDRITDLIWERNNPAQEGLQDGKSDKQLAYETCYKYIRRTEKHYNNVRPKLTQQGIEAWERTRDKIRKFEADSEVKPFK